MMNGEAEALALELWARREASFPPFTRRRPDALDRATGAWQRMLAEAEDILAVPRHGSITLNDYRERGMTAVVITCPKCDRQGRYSIESAEARWGVDAMLTRIHDDLTADCPRNLDALNMVDRCGAVFDHPF